MMFHRISGSILTHPWIIVVHVFLAKSHEQPSSKSQIIQQLSSIKRGSWCFIMVYNHMGASQAKGVPPNYPVDLIYSDKPTIRGVQPYDSTMHQPEPMATHQPPTSAGDPTRQGLLCDENFNAIAEAANLKDLEGLKKAQMDHRG